MPTTRFIQCFPFVETTETAEVPSTSLEAVLATNTILEWAIAVSIEGGRLKKMTLLTKEGNVKHVTSTIFIKTKDPLQCVSQMMIYVESG